MTYWVNHLAGHSDIEYPLDSLAALYDELSGANQEHTDVSLTHETEWSLAAFSSGLLVLENVAGEGESVHMKNVSKEKTLSLWRCLAEGKIEVVQKEDWKPGYGR